MQTMKWLKKNWYIIAIPVVAILIGSSALVSKSLQKPVVAPQVVSQTKIVVPVAEQPLATVASLLAAANAERAKAGVPALIIDARLNQSAQLKADDMTMYDYFAHVSPKDNRHGYEYIKDFAPGLCLYGGENIHEGSGSTAPTFSGWVDSKTHYAAMIDAKYTVTGFGIAKYKDSSNQYSNAYAIVEHFCQVK